MLLHKLIWRVLKNIDNQSSPTQKNTWQQKLSHASSHFPQASPGHCHREYSVPSPLPTAHNDLNSWSELILLRGDQCRPNDKMLTCRQRLYQSLYQSPRLVAPLPGVHFALYLPWRGSLIPCLVAQHSGYKTSDKINWGKCKIRAFL